MLRLDVPAVELDDRSAVGTVVAVSVGDEDQVRGRANPDSAEAQFDAGVVGPPIGEHGPPIEPAVTVGVFEDEDAVLAMRPAEPDGIRIILDHPEPATVIERHGDRLDDVGLGGAEGHVEAFRNRDLPGCFQRRDGRFRRDGNCRGRRRRRLSRRKAQAECHDGCYDQARSDPSNESRPPRSHVR